MALSFRFHSPYLAQFRQDPLPLFVEGLGAARQTLELCTESKGVEFLIAKVSTLREQGVRIRWVVSLDELAEKEAAEAIQKLRSLFRDHALTENEEWRIIKAAEAKLHPAFCVIDRAKVIWVSHPLSLEGLYLQESASISSESSEVAWAFQRGFQTYWDDVETINREITKTPFLPGLVSSTEGMPVGPDQMASVYFLPSDQDVIEKRLIETAIEAEESIFFALPCLENPELVDALEDAAKNGIAVQGVLDAHQAHVDHFWRAPTLRQLALSGKIRFSRGFAKKGKKLLDLVQLKLLVSDSRFVFCAAERFDSRRTNTQADVRWRGESAWALDSISIAKQAIQAIEAWKELAHQGGHTFAGWGYRDRYPFPKDWASVETRVVAKVKKVATKVAVKVVKKVAAKLKTKAKKPASKKTRKAA
ncbi:MAG: hypothetical protein JNL01_05325 [Bdellovibrionales bacterium]|nr:hypothetical protein [Bdellovibrionales bacterium]